MRSPRVAHHGSEQRILPRGPDLRRYSERPSRFRSDHQSANTVRDARETAQAAPFSENAGPWLAAALLACLDRSGRTVAADITRHTPTLGCDAATRTIAPSSQSLLYRVTSTSGDPASDHHAVLPPLSTPIETDHRRSPHPGQAQKPSDLRTSIFLISVNHRCPILAYSFSTPASEPQRAFRSAGDNHYYISVFLFLI
jgi:hypothetical protein